MPATATQLEYQKLLRTVWDMCEWCRSRHVEDAVVTLTRIQAQTAHVMLLADTSNFAFGAEPPMRRV